MTVRFDVQGKTLNELERKARRIIAQASDTEDRGWDITIEASPFIMQRGTDAPEIWRGEITAVKR